MSNKTSIARQVNQIMKQVSIDTLQTGKDWYVSAHVFAESLALKYSLPLDRVVGIIAALSPSTRWKQNKVDAENIIRDGELATVTTYGRNKQKALDILAGGDPFKIVHGRKVTPFFINILDPTDKAFVTVDRWILRTFGIIDKKEQKKVFDSDKRYEFIADVIRRKAEDYNLVPCQLQAVIWEHTRRGEL